MNSSRHHIKRQHCLINQTTMFTRKIRQPKVSDKTTVDSVLVIALVLAKNLNKWLFLSHCKQQRCTNKSRTNSDINNRTTLITLVQIDSHHIILCTKSMNGILPI